MKVAAIIPARGGSERVPRKNLAEVGGRSLLHWAILSAAPCDWVYVSTDDSEIAHQAQGLGAIVRHRPAHLATSTATTEAVMVDWWRWLHPAQRPDVIVLLQPTSPLRTAAHVRDALALLESSGADSVCSVKLNGHAHFAGRSYPRDGWRQFRPFRPIDWRPRSQDARAIVEENGAIYVTRRAAWESTLNRMGGTVAELRMTEDESIDIDTADDLERARDAMRRVLVDKRRAG